MIFRNSFDKLVTKVKIYYLTKWKFLLIKKWKIAFKHYLKNWQCKKIHFFKILYVQNFILFKWIFKLLKLLFFRFKSLSIYSTKFKSALQPTLKSISLFLFTNNNFSNFLNYKFHISRLVSVLVKEKIIFVLICDLTMPNMVG